ncbi:MAG: hypothetical protein IPL79_05935 [Myxococcales bacterium]|nr:hypothetical protein [Myxococcales bacterium]
MKWHVSSSLLAALAMMALWGGCAKSVLPTPTLAWAQQADVPLAELQAGREAYIAKCSSCHLAIAPADFTASEWPVHVDDMAERSKLSATQREHIVRYVTAYAKPEP